MKSVLALMSLVTMPIAAAAMHLWLLPLLLPLAGSRNKIGFECSGGVPRLVSYARAALCSEAANLDPTSWALTMMLI